MTRDEMVKKTNGLLARFGYKLVEAGDNWYNITDTKANEVVGGGTLQTCFYAAYAVANRGRDEMGLDASYQNDSAYQAGLEMAKKLNSKKEG